jgi:Tol biopolymer transport system component
VTSVADRLSAALAGRYRIERELGAGGMATVYLADDLKHDRKVAIKVLKPELAAVLGAERFVVEIKTTAAMSHPHILPLFDSGTVDGFLFYVMPYIQGETIREKLNRESQFGVDEAVRVAREVADALDYAHRSGVIHRDIKPENILLHDGRAMVMDFGIALAVSAAAGGRMTETGLSLGTPHYMSPEQATADKEITRRSDVYSLASVLYEMLAGEPPHTGGTAQQVIMKIIAEPCQPVRQLRKNVPANVDAAVGKALEKLPADRFESAKEFADALANSAYITSRRAAATAERLASPASWSSATKALAAVAAALAVALGVALAKGSSTAAGDAGVIQFALTSDVNLRIDAGSTRPFAISPDGRMVVFRANLDSITPRLWIRTLGDPHPRAIEGTEGGVNATFSPSGEWIAFTLQNISIMKVRAAGGPVLPVARVASRTAALAWGEDDHIYAEMLGNTEGIHRVSASGGQLQLVVPIDTASGEVSQRRPFLIPGTETIAYASASPGGAEPLIALFRQSDGKRARLELPGIGVLGYFDGRLVYSRADGTLMAAEVDVRGMRATGAPVPLEPRVVASTVGTSVILSPQGTLVYAASFGGSTFSLALVDTSGSLRLLGERMPPGGMTFSPDGRRILTGSSSDAIAAGAGATAAQEVRVLDLASKVVTRVRVSGNPLYATWNADGTRLLSPRSANGTIEVMSIPLDGGPATRLVSFRAAGGGAAELLPGGRSFIFGATLDQGGAAVLRVWIDGSGKVDTLVTEARDRVRAFRPRPSPNGRAVAFIERNSGDVYVQSLSGGGALQVSEAPARVLRPVAWSPDSRRLYYDGANGLNIVEIETSPTLRIVGRRAKSGFPIGMAYDLSPDGKSFITFDPGRQGLDVWVAVNWIDEARRVWRKK